MLTKQQIVAVEALISDFEVSLKKHPEIKEGIIILGDGSDHTVIAKVGPFKNLAADLARFLEADPISIIIKDLINRGHLKVASKVGIPEFMSKLPYKQ